MKKDVLLSVNNLSVQFQQDSGLVNAVNKLSFDLEKGKIMGIVGESGSGKSVTSLAIMGLLDKNAKISGSVKLDAIELISASEKYMRSLRGHDISMVFQEPMTSLNPVQRCGKQVIEIVLQHTKLSKKGAKELVLEWFDKVNLSNPEQVFTKYPHELSGGQKQRVMLAMAMITKPHVLIADEPTTALDVTVQAEVLSIFKELKNEVDTSIIFITHDLGVVAEVADDVLVMYKGDKIEHGPVKEVFSKPSSLYTKALLACRPAENLDSYRLPTISQFMDSEGHTVPVVPEKEKECSEENLVEVIGLSKTYVVSKNILGKPTAFFSALDQATFNVKKGTTLGIVGESGSGKTTLGQCMLRLTEPISGEVVFNGQSVTALSKKELKKLRKDIQIIFQDPYSSLNPKMRVGEAIVEVMKVHKLHGSRKERIIKAKELLVKVGLEADHFYRYPFEFSGGQRQRVSIARALAVEPQLIICDESVSALDVSVQSMVLNLLNDLKEQLDLTYLFISHDLSVIRYMSDEIIVLQNGKIVERGNAKQVYENPVATYTKELIDAIPTKKLASYTHKN